MADPYVYIIRFLQKEMAPGIPCYAAADSVYSLIDTVPTQLDSEPDVNYGIGLSNTELASDEYHYCLGRGNPTDLRIDSNGQDAWQRVMGFRPDQGTIAQCLSQHFMQGGDPKGLDCMKPLTAGFNRKLEIYLGGNTPIWEHTITGLEDSLALPVLQTEAEGLAQIYSELGELHYRLALGACEIKYKLPKPIKYYINLMAPGRENLPPLDSLTPQTVKTETWPTNGAITSGQDNTWTQYNNTWTVSGGIVSCVNSATPSYAILQYAFGSADRAAAMTIKQSPSASFGTGPATRSNVTFTDYYLGYTGAGANAGKGEVYKSVSSVGTLLVTGTMSLITNSVFNARTSGPTHSIAINNGVANATVTDSAISTGSYSFLYCYSAPAGQACSVISFDDLVTSGGPFPKFFFDSLNGNIRQGMRGI